MPQSEPVDDQERDQVLEQSEPIADSIFQAINDHDYATFSKDFDETMKKSLDENSFNTMTQTFDERIGAYQSRTVEKVERVETLYVVTYKARFEKEDVVDIRLTVREGEPTQVAGLWFDSPKLRAK